VIEFPKGRILMGCENKEAGFNNSTTKTGAQINLVNASLKGKNIVRKA